MELADIADLLNGVINDYQRDEVQQTQLLVDHPGVRMFLENAKDTSGAGVETNIRVRETPTGKWVGLFELTPNARVDLMKKMKTVIKHYEEKVHYDMKEEAFISNEKTRIYDHIIEQVNGAITKTWTDLETGVIQAPLTSADTKKIVGLSFLMPPIAAGQTDYEGSFNGIYGRYMNGATSSIIENIDRSDATCDRVRSFAMTRRGSGFNEETNRQAGLMIVKTGFRAIPLVKGASGSMPTRRRTWLMGTNDYSNWKNFVRNTGLGKTAAGDVGGEENPMWHGFPVEYVPAIDDLSFNPIYLIDNDKIQGRKLPGRWMDWSDPINSRDGIDIFSKALRNSVLLNMNHPRHAGGVLADAIAA